MIRMISRFQETIVAYILRFTEVGTIQSRTSIEIEIPVKIRNSKIIKTNNINNMELNKILS